MLKNRIIINEETMHSPTPANLPEETYQVLCYCLWHHQGGKSPVGQPIRKMLGLGQFDQMTPKQVSLAKKLRDTIKNQETITAIHL